MTGRSVASRWPGGRALLAGGAVAGAVSAGGWRGGALSGSGALAGTAVGTAVVAFGGVPAASSMVAFFGLSSALSKLGRGRKAAMAAVAAKGERRDAAQVLANGGVAVVSVVAGRLVGIDGFPAYLGALAAATADTWSTEIGGLSPAAPRSIVSGRRVAAGTSGGVTALGILASAAGGAAVGLVAGLAGRRDGLRTGIVAGLAGSLFDSLLGATVQGIRWCPCCRRETERLVHRCGTPTVPLRGWQWLDNDGVNLLATLCGAVAGQFFTRAETDGEPLPPAPLPCGGEGRRGSGRTHQ